MNSSDELCPAHPNESESPLIILRSLAPLIACPSCHARTVSVSWHKAESSAPKAAIDFRCSSCGITHTRQVALPPDVPDSLRLAGTIKAIQEQSKSIADKIRRHVQAMPAAEFTTNPLWAKARWSATTFRWHPASEAPPIMGLVFDDDEAGKQLFQEAGEKMHHADEFEEICISIIEGTVAGQEGRPGYSVHICPDPESLAARATTEDFVLDPKIVPFLGQWNRHYLIPGQPALLPRFKREFEQHNEFLLAPVVRRSDGQLWFEPESGIVKNVIHFRQLSEITPDDPDAGALILPQLIAPPV